MWAAHVLAEGGQGSLRALLGQVPLLSACSVSLLPSSLMALSFPFPRELFPCQSLVWGLQDLSLLPRMDTCCRPDHHYSEQFRKETTCRPMRSRLRALPALLGKGGLLGASSVIQAEGLPEGGIGTERQRETPATPRA